MDGPRASASAIAIVFGAKFASLDWLGGHLQMTSAKFSPVGIDSIEIKQPPLLSSEIG